MEKVSRSLYLGVTSEFDRDSYSCACMSSCLRLPLSVNAEPGLIKVSPEFGIFDFRPSKSSSKLASSLDDPVLFFPFSRSLSSYCSIDS